MNIESKVFLQLEKVQPSESKKLELGLIDDAAQLTAKLRALNQSIYKNGEKANEILKEVQSDGRLALAIFKDMGTIRDKVNDMYQELGLPADPESDPKIKAMEDERDLLLKYRVSYRF